MYKKQQQQQRRQQRHSVHSCVCLYDYSRLSLLVVVVVYAALHHLPCLCVYKNKRLVMANGVWTLGVTARRPNWLVKYFDSLEADGGAAAAAASADDGID